MFGFPPAVPSASAVSFRATGGAPIGYPFSALSRTLLVDHALPEHLSLTPVHTGPSSGLWLLGRALRRARRFVQRDAAGLPAAGLFTERRRCAVGPSASAGRLAQPAHRGRIQASDRTRGTRPRGVAASVERPLRTSEAAQSGPADHGSRRDRRSGCVAPPAPEPGLSVGRRALRRSGHPELLRGSVLWPPDRLRERAEAMPREEGLFL